MTNERDEAVGLANRLLDEPLCDPDDDIRVLSRQLLRRHEEIASLQDQLTSLRARLAVEEKESVYPWLQTADGTPPRNEPVLCAWRRGDKWTYRVAKFGGKRWLDVIPETDNEEYTVPDYWQPLRSPSEPRAAQVQVDPALDWHDIGCIKRYGAVGAAMCACEKRRAESRS